MKFILTPVGTYGDVHPYVGIACRLQQLGHEVLMICNPHFTDLMATCGIEMVALRTREEFDACHHNEDIENSLKTWKIWLKYAAVRPMREMYDLIAERYVPGKTVVVGPCWSFGARIANEKLGVPLATVYTERQWIRSLHETSMMPRPMLMDPWVPRPLKQLQFWLTDRFLADRYLKNNVNGFRSELGLAPVERFLAQWSPSPQRVIGLFPDWVFPPQPDWPPQTRLTGFPIWDRGTVIEIPEEVKTFIDRGAPPIVFSPGTENSQAKPFFAAAAEACKTTGRRGMLVTKFRELLPETLPEGVEHFPYVPFSWLLPRSAALVHHAGTGTTALCMKAGIPHVVRPMEYEQRDTAGCLRQLGIAQMILPKHFTAHNLANALDDILNSDAVADNCVEIASRFENVDPIGETCRLLEELGKGSK